MLEFMKMHVAELSDQRKKEFQRKKEAEMVKAEMQNQYDEDLDTEQFQNLEEYEAFKMQEQAESNEEKTHQVDIDTYKQSVESSRIHDEKEQVDKQSSNDQQQQAETHTENQPEQSFQDSQDFSQKEPLQDQSKINKAGQRRSRKKSKEQIEAEKEAAAAQAALEAQLKEEEQANKPKRRSRTPPPTFEVESPSNIKEQTASNGWVISGKHTLSGKPLLAGDPHLGTGIPSFWTVSHLQYNNEDGKETYIQGSSNPGVPLVYSGTTEDLAWGISSSMVDVSDLYREQIDLRQYTYSVDGQQQNLKSKRFEIKVKGKDSVNYEVLSTHRGPVISTDLLSEAQGLFGQKIPISSEQTEFYSFSWGGNYVGESYLALLEKFSSCKELHCLKDHVNSLKQWRSMPANILMADSSGNIGYFLASPSMRLNNSSPYLSTSVFDGAVSDNDVLGLVSSDSLPFLVNPSKGYFAVANNRVMPENTKSRIGVSGTITPRATMINQILKTGIKSGRKFSKQDMIDYQNDVVDVVARESTPKIIKICRTATIDLSRDDLDSVEFMLDLLTSFNGEMSAQSVGASVYNFWNYFFLTSLFQDQTTNLEKEGGFWNEKTRALLVDRYNFVDFYQKVIIDVEKQGGKYEIICKGASQNYKGPHFCQYSMALAFARAREFMTDKFSSDTSKWKWGETHSIFYQSLPWQNSQFKGMFEREIFGRGGNGNTLSISRYALELGEKSSFRGTHTQTYKQIIDFNDRGKSNWVSFDTGVSGNVLSKNYFDLNQNHTQGDLQRLETDFSKMNEMDFYKSEIKAELNDEINGDKFEMFLRSFIHK